MTTPEPSDPSDRKSLDPSNRQEYLEHNGVEIPVRKGSLADKMTEHPRISGVVWILLAGLTSKFQVFDVLEKARNTPNFEYTGNHDVIATGLLLGIGLALLLGGKTFDRLLKSGGRNQDRSTARSWILIICCLLPALILYLWMEEQLKSY